jgi:hypothetical protein
MRQIRLLQVLFIVAIGAGVLTAASGAPNIGVVLIGLGVLGFFVLVAIVGWQKAGK